jgi:hypothetical protein
MVVHIVLSHFFYHMGLVTATLMVVTTIAITAHLIWSHAASFEQPRLQVHVMRILVMAPVYSFVSSLSILNPENAEFYSFSRDCYEALTIYSFFKLLIEMLGGEAECAIRMSRKPSVALLPPLDRVMDPWLPGEATLVACKDGILQYVVIKPLCAFIVLATTYTGTLHAHEWRIDGAWAWVFVISNVSQVAAMYFLIYFYFICQEDLALFNPVPKFLVVKLVVFATFWQNILLGIIRRLGFFDDDGEFSSLDVEAQIENWIVCVEMLIIAYMHHRIFSVEEFVYTRVGAESGGVDVTDNFVDAVPISRQAKLDNIKQSVLPRYRSSVLFPRSFNTPHPCPCRSDVVQDVGDFGRHGVGTLGRGQSRVNPAALPRSASLPCPCEVAHAHIFACRNQGRQARDCWRTLDQ